MPDGLSFKVDTRGVSRDLRAIDNSVKRAGMYIVRESARRVKRAARRRVPVDSGALKDGIRSAKRLRGGPRGESSVVVGPRGQRVHLYAQQVEARTHFMEHALAEAEREIPHIAQRAWANATRKGRR